MFPIDPTADQNRRAWLPCPACDHGRNCVMCLAGRCCPRHWQYLLGNTARMVHLQCAECGHLWDCDTGQAPAA